MNSTDFNFRPSFCPFSGRMCAGVEPKCLNEGCERLRDNLTKPLPKIYMRACVYYPTCLVPMTDGCNCQKKEHDLRKCDAYLNIITIEEFRKYRPNTPIEE